MVNEDGKGRVVRGVVTATTDKYGGGVKIDGKWYDNKSGQPLPEKDAEITAIVIEDEIIHWKHANGSREAPPTDNPCNGQVPGDILEAAEILERCYEAIKGKPEYADASDESKRKAASVIFKEIMEGRRFKGMLKE